MSKGLGAVKTEVKEKRDQLLLSAGRQEVKGVFVCVGLVGLYPYAFGA